MRLRGWAHMTSEAWSDARNARAELAATLDAIEHKLNVPRRVRLSAHRFGRRVRAVRDENPLAIVGIAIGAAVVIGGGVWVAVRMLSK
jgi:hypothetical protein